MGWLRRVRRKTGEAWVRIPTGTPSLSLADQGEGRREGGRKRIPPLSLGAPEGIFSGTETDRKPTLSSFGGQPILKPLKQGCCFPRGPTSWLEAKFTCQPGQPLNGGKKGPSLSSFPSGSQLAPSPPSSYAGSEPETKICWAEALLVHVARGSCTQWLPSEGPLAPELPGSLPGCLPANMAEAKSPPLGQPFGKAG